MASQGTSSVVAPLYCRLCLQQDVDELVSLYCHCATQTPQQLIADMVTDLTRLPRYVQVDDGLSQFICDQCLTKLDQACTFKKAFRMGIANYNREVLQNGCVQKEHACRICDEDNPPGESMLSVFCVCEGGLVVADMLADVTGTNKASPADRLPQNVCSGCYGMLMETVAFRSMILENDTSQRGDQGEPFELADAHEYLQRAEEGWSVPGKVPGDSGGGSQLAMGENDDPFVYLDVPNVQMRMLKSLFSIAQDTEFYDFLEFGGVICCCRRMFRSDVELRNHRRQHVKSEMALSDFKCTDCKKYFGKKLFLTLHKQEPKRKYFYRCKICNIITKDKRVLEQHFETTRFHPILDFSEEDQRHFDAIAETQYEADGRCCGCNEQFPDSTSLLDHSKALHQKECPPNPKFLCMLCYTSFPDGQALLEHQKTYSGTRTYYCRAEGCDFESDDRAVIRKHAETGLHCNSATLERAKALGLGEGQKREFYCCFRGCTEVHRSMFDLEQHCLADHMEKRITNRHFSKDAADGNICNLCQRHYGSEALLNRHKRTITSRSYICTNCGLKYPTRETLARHEKIHQADDPTKTKVVYPCPECPLSLGTPYSLGQHISRVHRKLVTDVCNHCGKHFMSKHALKAHETNTHMKIKPYKCHLCPTAFGAKALLQNHIRTHDGDRPFQCSYCDKSYRHKNDLTRHEQATHLDNKPYICELCDSRFVRDRDLRLHMVSHTKIKLFECKKDGCSYSTNIAKQLTEHYNEAH